jgi:hypothetical protein
MDDLIRIPDAIREYGVSRHQINRMHARGLLPLRKCVGERAALVRRGDLVAALAIPRPPGRRRRAPQDGG